MYSRPQKLAAELFGTFAFVLVSAGAICADQFLKTTNGSGFGPLGIALAYGLAFGVFVAATSRISGGHLNPAVTIGYWITRRLNSFDMLTYCGAQLAGACVAAYLLRAVLPEETWRAVALGTPDLTSGLTRAPGMLIEGVLTMLLVFTASASATAPAVIDHPDPGASPAMTGMATGLLITAAVLFGGPFTGAAMNPARVFGPALASRHWTNHGVYWVGPLAGGAAGAAIYSSLFLRRRPARS
jgi:MIP family channel proteins